MKTIISSVAFQDERGNALVSGSLIFTLPQGIYEIAAGGGQVPGSSVIVNLDATAKIPASTQLWASDELTPQTPYNVTICAGANGASPLGSSSWLISGSSPIDLSQMASTAAGISFASPVLLNPTGQQTISGQSLVLAANTPLTVNGNVTEIAGQNQYKAFKFNSELWVDGIKYTSIMAAYADLPSTGGCVMVPPNYSETVIAGWTLNKSYSAIIFTGPASLVFGSNQIVVPVGTHGVYIGSSVPWGSVVTVAGTGVEFNYTGLGTFITVGDVTADTMGIRLSDLCYFLNNAGSSAIAIKAVRCPIGLIERPNVIGPGGAVSQQGIILDGTGNYTGLEVRQPRITGMLKGIQLTGSGVNAANACQIYGGNISSPATGASIGIDFQAGSGGNIVIGTDVEAHAIGYNFGGSATGNFIWGRSEGNTSGATLGASTTSNEVRLINSGDPIADSGTNNITAPTPQSPSYATLNATTFKGRGASTVSLNDGSGASRLFANGSSNLFVNFGGGGTLFGPNTSPIFSTGGIVTNYGQIATVSNGVPAEYATVDSTAQAAAQATTTLYAVPASGAGQYRVSWNAKVTTAATTSSQLGALTITYTDPDGTPISCAVAAQQFGGGMVTNATSNNTSTFLMGVPLTINAKASTNIQYSFAYASVGATAMQYNLHIKLEAL